MLPLHRGDTCLFAQSTRMVIDELDFPLERFSTLALLEECGTQPT